MRVYFEAAMLVIISVLIAAFFYMKASNAGLEAAKVTAENSLNTALEANRANAQAMADLKQAFDTANVLAAQTQAKADALARQINGVKEELLTNVQETNACAGSPAVNAALDWLRGQEGAARGAGGSAGAKAGPGHAAEMPLPPKRP